MTCERVPLPGGGTAIVCGTRKKKRCVGCGRPATLECDWKVPERRSGTCDAPICARCTVSPAPDKDLCPAHAEAWDAWKLRKSWPCSSSGHGPIETAGADGESAPAGERSLGERH